MKYWTLEYIMDMLTQITKNLSNSYCSMNIWKLLASAQDMMCEDFLKRRKYFSSQLRIPRAAMKSAAISNGVKESVLPGKSVTAFNSIPTEINH